MIKEQEADNMIHYGPSYEGCRTIAHAEIKINPNEPTYDRQLTEDEIKEEEKMLQDARHEKLIGCLEPSVPKYDYEKELIINGRPLTYQMADAFVEYGLKYGRDTLVRKLYGFRKNVGEVILERYDRAAKNMKGKGKN